MLSNSDTHTNRPHWFSFFHFGLIATFLGIIAGNFAQQLLLFFQPNVSSLQARTVSSLVPPGITICVNSELYTFKIYNYGILSSSQVSIYTVDTQQTLQDTFGNIITKCWVFFTTNSTIVSEAPAGVNPITVNYFRTFNTSYPTPATFDPMYLSVWDPLVATPATEQDTDAIFNYGFFSLLAADNNREIAFTRREHNLTNRHSIPSISYQLTQLFRPNTASTTIGAESNITIRASSFEIETTVDSPPQTWLHFLISNINIIMSVITAHAVIWGPGKYAPWGIFHKIIGYFPSDHVKTEYLQSNRFSTMSGMKNNSIGLNPKSPTQPFPLSPDNRTNSVYVDSNNVLVTRHVELEERLRVYLQRWDGQDRDFLRWLPWRMKQRKKYIGKENSSNLTLQVPLPSPQFIDERTGLTSLKYDMEDTYPIQQGDIEAPQKMTEKEKRLGSPGSPKREPVHLHDDISSPKREPVHLHDDISSPKREPVHLHDNISPVE